MHRRDPKRFLERVCWGDEADHIDTLLTDLSRVIFVGTAKPPAEAMVKTFPSPPPMQAEAQNKSESGSLLRS